MYNSVILDYKYFWRYMMLKLCQLGWREDSDGQMSCWLIKEKEERSRGGGGDSRMVDGS